MTLAAETRNLSRQNASVARTFISGLIRSLLQCPMRYRQDVRQLIVRHLGITRDPNGAIDELLHYCITRGGTDGLDIAIDILASTKRLVFDYAWKYIREDILAWTPASERSYQPNDDYWYVLLRAVARTEDVDEKQKLLFINCCSNAESRAIREGVIEALRDLGSESARAKLKQIAQQDTDQFIVRIASEALAEAE